MNNVKSNIHLKILCIFFVYSLTMAYSKKVLAQDFKFLNGRKVQTITFSLIKNLIIIPIYINEKGPYDFILDTGVNPIIVTDSTLKESLKVPFARTIKISGYGNFEGIDAFLGTTDVKIGDAEAKNIQTVFLKNNSLPLSGFLGKKIYGLIGYNFFNSFLIKVDYTTKSLKFAVQRKKIKLKGEKIIFELIENKPYVLLKMEQEGLANKTIKALVDCGASHAISFEALKGKPFPKPILTIKANLGNSLTGQVNGSIGRISSLKIGNNLLKDVISNYPEYNINLVTKSDRNANLGAEILSRFNTIYDYQNSCMYIKKNERFNRIFEHDMSGMELYTEVGPPTRTIINKIEPESPADLVDLKEGDEIISINFKRIEEFSLDEISALFKAKNGYSMILEIWRNKSMFIKLLKLKKRI